MFGYGPTQNVVASFFGGTVIHFGTSRAERWLPESGYAVTMVETLLRARRAVRARGAMLIDIVQ